MRKMADDNNNNIHRSHFANQLNESFIGQKVRIGGWIEDIRDIGRLAFVVVRDVTGAIQAIVTGDNLQLAKNTPRQSAVIISGMVQKNKTNDFLLEIIVEQ
jgi:nondiscriminating aspartyl-tRNA synthetase